MFLLRTNTTADCRQTAGLLYYFVCGKRMTCFYLFDKSRNVDSHRATLNTTWIGTVETTLRLTKSHLGSESLINFFIQCGSTILRHLNSGNSYTLFRFDRQTQLLAPFAVARNLSKTIQRLFNARNACVQRLFKDAIPLYGRGVRGEAVLPCLIRLSLLLTITAKAREHLVEINLMCIELRSIHAHKAGLACYSNTASATHTCAIHHDSVQTGFGRNIVFLCEERYEFHHYGRADSDTFVHLLTLDDRLNALSDKSFCAITPVIGHDNHFVRKTGELRLKNNKFFCSSGENSDHPVACFLKSFGNRKHRSSSHSSASTYHRAELLYVSSFSKRTNHISH